MLLALALLASGCAGERRAARGSTLPPPVPESRAGVRDPGAGPAFGQPPRLAQGRRMPHDAAVSRALDTARALVGRRDIVVAGVRYGDGCADLVRAAFAEAGALLPESADARTLHDAAKARGATRRWRPAPGDLVFLSDRPGGPPEHVGIVESVSADGTALILHRTEYGVLRLRANGGSPWKLRGPSGRAMNDVLVVSGGRIPAGRLLVAYATML